MSRNDSSSPPRARSHGTHGRKGIEIIAQARPEPEKTSACRHGQPAQYIPPLSMICCAPKRSLPHLRSRRTIQKKSSGRFADIIGFPESHGRGASVSCRSATYNVNNEMNECISVCTVHCEPRKDRLNESIKKWGIWERTTTHMKQRAPIHL
jgi:hypothetical protein